MRMRSQELIPGPHSTSTFTTRLCSSPPSSFFSTLLSTNSFCTVRRVSKGSLGRINGNSVVVENFLDQIIVEWDNRINPLGKSVWMVGRWLFKWNWKSERAVSLSVSRPRMQSGRIVLCSQTQAATRILKRQLLGLTKTRPARAVGQRISADSA